MMILVGLIGYMLGAIPFGFVIAKSAGIDIREHGSGNVGFTNVWRTLGLPYGLLVLFFDLGKGTLAAYLGSFLTGDPNMAILGGVAAIIGHTFSVFLHFKGGKGVATGAGVLLYLSPITMLACLAIVIIITALTKYLSLGSIVAAWLCPVIIFATGASDLETGVIAVICLYVIWLHRANIKRLRNKTENKVGFRVKK